MPALGFVCFRVSFLSMRVWLPLLLSCVAFALPLDAKAATPSDFSALWAATCGNPSHAPDSFDPGAAQLTPGRYMSAKRAGHGWDFFWYTPPTPTCHASSGCPTVVADPQELFITFYTYRATPGGVGGAPMWRPIWYGAAGNIVFGTDSLGRPTRLGFQGTLREYKQINLASGGFPGFAGSGNTGVDDGTVVGDVTFAFGAGVGLSANPDAVAVRWNLSTAAQGTGQTFSGDKVDCLRNYRGLVISAPGDAPLDSRSGAWAPSPTTGWLLMPYFYENFQHHVLLYFEKVGNSTNNGIPRWVHAQVPSGQQATLPSTHACRNAPVGPPTLATEAGESWTHLCLMSVRGYNPYKEATDGDVDWQWDNARKISQLRLGWLSHTFMPGVVDKGKVNVRLDPPAALPTGVSPIEMTFAPRGIENENDAPLLNPTPLVHLNNLSRVHVNDALSALPVGPKCRVAGTSNTTIGAQCSLRLHWFTEGSFPNAALFRARTIQGADSERLRLYRDVPRTASGGQAYLLGVPGDTYEFELWSDTSRRELLAKSAPVTVEGSGTGCVGLPATTLTPIARLPTGAVAKPSTSLAFQYDAPTAGCILTLRLQVFRKRANDTWELVHEVLRPRDAASPATYTMTDIADLGDLSAAFKWRVQAFDSFGRAATSTELAFSFAAPTIGNVTPQNPVPPATELVAPPSGKAGVDGGAATYEMPIRVAPGRNGVQPSLALTYSSRAGNGIAGMGWGLSGLSSIHRCAKTVAQDNVSEPVRFDANDALCLDGQRLVYVGGGARGTTSAQYRTEIDSFTLVVQQGNLASGAVSFTAYTSDNQIIEYGTASNSALTPAFTAAPSANATLTWSIAKRSDRSGNAVHYLYDVDTTRGEQTLREIQYSGALNDANNRKVSFLYDARPVTGTGKDVSSSYFAGGLVMSTKRLSTITSSAPGSASTFSYRLEYGNVSQTSGRSVLRRIVPKAGAIDLPALDVAWSEGALSFQFSRTFTPTQDASLPIVPITMPISVQEFAANAAAARREHFKGTGDLDGDGWREGIYSFLGGRSYLLSFNPDRTVKSLIDIAKFTADEAITYGISYDADIDNDGRADLVGRVGLTPGAKAVIRFRKPGSPDTFAEQDFEVFETNVPVGGYDAHVLDLNGDGAADFLVDEGTFPDAPSCFRRIKTYINQTPSMAGANARTPTFFAQPQICLPRRFVGSSAIDPHATNRYDDFDGNGLPDLWIQYGTSLASGTDHILFAQRSGATAVSYAPRTIGNVEPGLAHLFWLDVNADGLLDWVGQNPDDIWVIKLNTGGTLGVAIKVTGAAQAGLVYPPTVIPRPSGAPPSVTTQPSANFWSGRFKTAIQPFDIDSDGRVELLMPAKLMMPVCLYHFPEDVPDPLRPPNPEESYFRCPSDVDGTWPYADGTEIDGEAVHPFYVGSGPGVQWDFSAYQMDAIEFVQTAPQAFEARVRSTPIIARLSGGASDDFFGDGLDDLHTSMGCPLRKRTTLSDPPEPCGIVETRADGKPWGLFSALGVTPGSPAAATLVSEMKTKLRMYTTRNRGVLVNGTDRPAAPQLPDLVSRISWNTGKPAAGTQWASAPADIVEWDYHPLSATLTADSKRGIPLYTVPARDLNVGYADAEHFYFTSSMPVVSTMRESSGIGSSLAADKQIRRYFGYEQAMYNNRGRGFRGFRRVIEQNAATGIYSQTLFAQKFPFAGAATCSVSATSVDSLNCIDTPGNTKIPGGLNVAPSLELSSTTAISETKGSWDASASCAGLAPDASLKCWHVRPRTQIVRSLDLISHALYTESASTTTYDALGQLLTVTTVVSDKSATGVDQVVRSTTLYNTYDSTSANALPWWRNKLVASSATQAVTYAGDQALPASHSAGNATRSSTTLIGYDGDATRRPACEAQFESTVMPAVTCAFVGAPGTAVPTNFVKRSVTGYGPYGNAIRVDVDAREGGARTLSQKRFTKLEFAEPGYFLTRSENALGHISSMGGYNTLVGKPTSVTDPNSLTTTFSYNALGQEIGVGFPVNGDGTLARPKSTSYQWCNSTLCGAQAEALFRSIVQQEGTPTSISYIDRRGRVLRTETQGLTAAQWIGTAREYTVLGDLLAERGPSNVSPNGAGSVGGRIVTYGRFDALRRPREKSADQLDLDIPAGGNGYVTVRTGYTYAGLTTNIEVAAVRNIATNPLVSEAFLRMSRTYASDGKVLRTVDANTPQGTTSFWYDGAGNPTLIRDVKNQFIVATYNNAGERLSVTDPSRGTWNFTYNGFGELIAQADARPYYTNYAYDALGRKVARTWSDLSGTDTGDIRYMRDTWTYDRDAIGIARRGALGVATRERVQSSGSIAPLTDHRAESVTQNYFYDGLMRPAREQLSLLRPGSQQRELIESASTYDVNFGRLKTELLPGLETVYYTYSPTGRMNEAGDASAFVGFDGANGYYEKTVAIDAFGHATSAHLRGNALGSGWTRTDTYDPTTGLLKRSSVPGVLDLTYRYDAYGNLKEQRDQLASTAGLRETYDYDALHRLKTTTRFVRDTTTPSGTATRYAYDAGGNLLTKSDLSQDNGYSYAAGGYRLQSIVRGVAPLGTTSFLYDANGNVTQRRDGATGRAIGYDIDNLPLAVLDIDIRDNIATANGQGAAFRYGPDGARYVQLISRHGRATRTVMYLGKRYEKELGAEGTIERWYLPGGAMKLKSTVPTVPSGLYYTHGDRLGSSSALTGPDSQVIAAERRAFDAFGRPRDWANWSATNADELSTNASGTGPKNRRGFTQHEQIDNSSLVHMNGRVYDADIGRFYGVDPFVQFPMNSQSLNPYSYIMNNPLSGTDPTGYAQCGVDANANTCLDDGVNTIVDANGNKSTVIVGHEGDRLEFSTSSGSIAGTIGSAGSGAGSISQLQREPSSIGELASRIAGAFDANANSIGISDVRRSTVSYTDEYRQQLTAEEMATGTHFSDTLTWNLASKAIEVGSDFVPGAGLKQGAEDFQQGNYISGALNVAGDIPVGKAFKGIGAGAGVLLPMVRGKLSEIKVLSEMRLAKNSKPVSTSEGTSIPDALTETASVEVKDAQKVSRTRQVRIQTEAARRSGRVSTLVTGENTCVSANCADAFDEIIRRADLGPQLP